ncbi:Translation initiation factor 2 subunit 1 [Monocercomonoides exilis]|uniref:Translation initiation factor 2 subunit 1 n=1 Tax=Monocercomonoides exilis TaxID=2049356 RepID=UPI003559D2C1|nr:Translation initiation factor 2 subunit 1 [Monocercomonoides exilis]|eukprot:MONOS_1725.1-p1 / transcript=MONOS_1725.1 / gene=MONOS_1725 / organism=Monocercomonoides_exilis_PA203 / gene_product=Translation initiation factor 2 subunit 1 / transcript_product=Translation initiation factor 2 subunit 1 / location=Mono_scaffold00032:56027-57514(+) / protein_length=308 / sequence_SO=supercontig / SO=protein_coding / is_pseudo=false
MSDRITHRYYENPLPNVGEQVVVQVSRLDEMGVYCKLIEYGGKEGFVPTPELSVARIKSIAQVTRVGKQEVVMVLRVDHEKGYIDLSKRRVESKLIARAMDRLTKSKTVHAILQAISQAQSIDIDLLYRNIAWPLAKKYGHAYDAFKVALRDPDSVFGDLMIEPKVREQLMQNILRRLNPQPIKLRAEIVLTCDSPSGVQGIKAALLAGEQSPNETDDIRIECKVKATPIYTIETSVLDKERGINALGQAIEVIREKIESVEGILEVKQEPTVVSGDSGPSNVTVEKEEIEDSEEEDTEDDEESDDN